MAFSWKLWNIYLLICIPGWENSLLSHTFSHLCTTDTFSNSLCRLFLFTFFFFSNSLENRETYTLEHLSHSVLYSSFSLLLLSKNKEKVFWPLPLKCRVIFMENICSVRGNTDAVAHSCHYYATDTCLDCEAIVDFPKLHLFIMKTIKKPYHYIKSFQQKFISFVSFNHYNIIFTFSCCCFETLSHLLTLKLFIYLWNGIQGHAGFAIHHFPNMYVDSGYVYFGLLVFCLWLSLASITKIFSQNMGQHKKNKMCLVFIFIAMYCSVMKENVRDLQSCLFIVWQ